MGREEDIYIHLDGNNCLHLHNILETFCCSNYTRLCSCCRHHLCNYSCSRCRHHLHLRIGLDRQGKCGWVLPWILLGSMWAGKIIAMGKSCIIYPISYTLQLVLIMCRWSHGTCGVSPWINTSVSLFTSHAHASLPCIICWTVSDNASMRQHGPAAVCSSFQYNARLEGTSAVETRGVKRASNKDKCMSESLPGSVHT